MRDTNLGLFLLSLLALATGPAVYQLARVAGYMLAVLDGFVFVAIGGLVLLHIVPESFALGGWVAIAAGIAGLMLPTAVEHRLTRLAPRVHAVALVLGLLAIALHAFTDGVALVAAPPGGAGDHHGHMLPMAVVLHRVPVGLTIWFLLRPLYGIRAAVGGLVLIAVATGAGFLSGEAMVGALASQGRAIFQAAVSGALLHVVIHRSYPLGEGISPGPERRWSGGVGAVGGGALVWGITSSHDIAPEIVAATQAFLSLARDSAPALLLAYVGAGLIAAFLPAASVAWMKRGTALSQALRGVASGLPLPICSCGVVPIYRSLITQGVPATAAMAFLVATPELSLDAILVSVPLLGASFTATRVACAVAVALLVAWSLGRFADILPGVAPSAAIAPEATMSVGMRLRRAAQTGLGEVVDSTAPWILLGLAAAALVHPLFRSEWFNLVPRNLEVLLFALLGMPAYVCASGATPLVAVLIYKGASPGAALAFLLTGPATNITTFGVLAGLHGRRIALLFGAGIAAASAALGLLVNGVLPWDEVTRSLSRVQEEALGLGDLPVAALGLLFLLSLLRRGPREFVAELFELGNAAEGGGGHAHDHGNCSCGAEEC